MLVCQISLFLIVIDGRIYELMTVNNNKKIYPEMHSSVIITVFSWSIAFLFWTMVLKIGFIFIFISSSTTSPWGVCFYHQMLSMRSLLIWLPGSLSMCNKSKSGWMSPIAPSLAKICYTWYASWHFICICSWIGWFVSDVLTSNLCRCPNSRSTRQHGPNFVSSKKNTCEESVAIMKGSFLYHQRVYALEVTIIFHLVSLTLKIVPFTP